MVEQEALGKRNRRRGENRRRCRKCPPRFGARKFPPPPTTTTTSNRKKMRQQHANHHHHHLPSFWTVRIWRGRSPPRCIRSWGAGRASLCRGASPWRWSATSGASLGWNPSLSCPSRTWRVRCTASPTGAASTRSSRATSRTSATRDGATRYGEGARLSFTHARARTPNHHTVMSPSIISLSSPRRRHRLSVEKPPLPSVIFIYLVS